MKTATAILTGLAIVTLVPSGVNAADCDAYALKYPAGLKLVNTPKGPKFLATAAVGVDIDDPGEVLDAKSEATMEAKALIAKFFNEDVKSEKNVNTLITKSIKFADGKKSVTKDKLKTTLKNISVNAAKLLRGVLPLASCYTKGKIVMVTVGLKPETIAAAESGSKLIDDSVRRQPSITKSNDGTKTGGRPGSSGAATGGTKSHSHGIKNLDKF